MIHNFNIQIEQKVLAVIHRLSLQAGDKYGVCLELENVLTYLDFPKKLGSEIINNLLQKQYLKFPSGWSNFIILTDAGYHALQRYQAQMPAQMGVDLSNCLLFVSDAAYKTSQILGKPAESEGPAYRIVSSEWLPERRINCTLEYFNGSAWKALNVMEIDDPLIAYAKTAVAAYLSQGGLISYRIESLRLDASYNYVFTLQGLRAVDRIEFQVFG